MAKKFTQTQTDWLKTLSAADQKKYGYNPSSAPPTGKKKKPTDPNSGGKPIPGKTNYSDPRQLATHAAEGADYWNQFAQDNAGGAIDWGKNNPYSNMAQGYIQDSLAGNMNRNPFMQDVYDKTHGVDMNEAFDLIRGFLGPGGGSGNSAQDRADRNRAIVASRGPASFGSSSQSGGNVPDTVGGSNSFFAQKIKDLFDPSRLDPANDPTLQPYIEAMRNENQENLYGSLNDVAAQMEGAGRYGSGLYQAMSGKTREEAIESLDQAIASAMMGSRQSALDQQMQGLGLTNQRDIAAMNDLTQRYGIDAQSAAAGAGSAAAAQDAADARRLQAIGMMMQGAQFGMGQQADMAGLMSNNQLGSLNAGQGYGQLGLQGYQTGAQMGQLGLGALGLQGQIAQGMGQYDLSKRQLGLQASMQKEQMLQDSLNDYMNILIGVGGMGGGSSQIGAPEFAPGYMGPNPLAAGISAGVGAGMQMYGGGFFGKNSANMAAGAGPSGGGYNNLYDPNYAQGGAPGSFSLYG